MSKNKPLDRFYELDLLRFLAAFSVLLFHYSFLNGIQVQSAPTYPFLKSIFKYGYFGVELFFMISGFVILLTAQNKTWKGFIVSRLSRLYPAFLIAVTVTSVLILILGSMNSDLSLSQYLWNLTMIPEYVGVQNIDPVYWTLQVEIKFYFWIFVLLLFKQVQHVEPIILIWLSISVLDVFGLQHEIIRRLFIPEWAPYFSAGALFYIIKTQGVNIQRLAMLSLCFSLSLYFATENAGSKTETYNFYFSPYVLGLLLIFYYAIFAYIINGKKIHLPQAWVIALGGISYPLYLLHQKIGALLFVKYASLGINKYLLLLLITTLIIIVSYVLYRYLEKGIAKTMKQKLEYFLHLPPSKIINEKM